MGSVISKKKGPEPKPKITEHDKEILVSESGFHFRKVDLYTFVNTIIVISLFLQKERVLMQKRTKMSY